MVDTIAQGQPWDVDMYTTGRSGSKKITAVLSISWSNPVSTSGPWKARICSDTVTVERSVLWHELTSITVAVTLQFPTVVSITPGGLLGPDAPEVPKVPGYPEPNQPIDPLPTCAPGTADD